mgnify:FL=1
MRDKNKPQPTVDTLKAGVILIEKDMAETEKILTASDL